MRTLTPEEFRQALKTAITSFDLWKQRRAQELLLEHDVAIRAELAEARATIERTGMLMQKEG